MDALEKIGAARSALVLQAPFFASLALRLDPAPAPAGMLREGEPAATDGRKVYFDAAEIEKLTHAETVGLMAHEALHPGLKHHIRRNGREMELWNTACDFAIDPVLLAAGFELPGGGHVRADLDGLSAENIYKILQDEQSFREENGQDPEPDAPNPTGRVLDWPGPGGEGEGESTPGDMPGGGDAPDRSPGPPSPAETQAEGERWDTATAAAMLHAAGAGKLPGGALALAMDSISPRVPWRDILAPFLQRTADDYSWIPPDRRFAGRGLFLPSLQSEGISRVVLAIDTSGSMPPALVSEILQETAEILEYWPGAVLQVLYHHSAVYRVEEYTSGDPPSLADYESGGTDFRPVFSHVDAEMDPPDCLVLLTDLDGPAPDVPPDYPVLWVSYGKDRAPWGEVVKIQ